MISPPGGDVLQGDFVGLRDGVAGGDAAFGQRPGGQVMHRHRHIVLLLDLNGQTFSHGCSLLFLFGGFPLLTLLYRKPGVPTMDKMP